MPFASSPLGHARSANVDKFRRAYDKKHNLDCTLTYHAGIHFATLNAMALFVIGYCFWRIVTASEPHWRGGMIVSVIAFMFGNTVEYCLHRFSMHHPDSTSDHSPVHHRYFTAASMFLKDFQDAHTIFFRVSFIFKGFFFVLPLIGWLIGKMTFPTAGYFFLSTGAAYYLQYEWLHLIYHSAPGSLLAQFPGVTLLRKHHRIHHYQPMMRTHNFNITYPIMDILFGTYYTGKPVYDESLDLTPPTLTGQGSSCQGEDASAADAVDSSSPEGPNARVAPAENAQAANVRHVHVFTG